MQIFGGGFYSSLTVCHVPWSYIRSGVTSRHPGLMGLSLNGGVRATNTRTQLRIWLMRVDPKIFGTLALPLFRSGQSTSAFVELAKEQLLAVATSHEAVSDAEAQENQPLSALLPHRAMQSAQRMFCSFFTLERSFELAATKTASRFGCEIVTSVFRFLSFCDFDAEEEGLISHLELYFGWRLATRSQLPVEDPVTKRWINPRHVLADAFTKTLSVDLAVFRGVVAGVARELGFSLGRGFIDLPHVSVYRRISASRHF